MHEPDPATIRSAAGGDLDAFEELVRAYQAHVWRYLRHLLSDAALAEDCTQETFLRIHRRLRTFRFRAKFSTWVFAIARNVGIDALRSRQRRQRLIAALPQPGPVGDASAALEVTEAIATLPIKLREAFLLVEVLGLTYRQAGEAAGSPEGTMKSRVFRARELLVTWMRADEDDAGGVAGGL